MHLLIIYLI
jgi:hypothetical protein